MLFNMPLLLLCRERHQLQSRTDTTAQWAFVSECQGGPSSLLQVLVVPRANQHNVVCGSLSGSGSPMCLQFMHVCSWCRLTMVPLIGTGTCMAASSAACRKGTVHTQ